MVVTLNITREVTGALPGQRVFVTAALAALARVPGARQPHLVVEASLVFVPTATMRRLNRTWRGTDRATDVLSFPRWEARRPPHARKSLKLGKISPVPDPDGVVRLGEIIIAPMVARRTEAAFGHGREEHMAFLIVHGMLHLVGYDHEASRAAEREMASLQARAFAALRAPRRT
jgi:probable rRNA maturation factor